MTLVQLWDIERGPGVIVKKEYVQLLSGKSRFLAPHAWERWYLHFKMEVVGGVTLCSSLQRPGVISGVTCTSGGMLRYDIYNTNSSVLSITPTTTLAVVLGYSTVRVERLAKVGTVAVEKETEENITADSLANEIGRQYADVGDLTQHPILPPMAAMQVRAEEVQWTPPSSRGRRTPYKTEQGACRFRVSEQLEDYVRRGYLRRVMSEETVSLSPLLPIKKKDGSYRFTNDFRWLNAHFNRSGMAQIDVWRRLWQIEPNWRYYAKLDLKDGFFGIPVDEELQRAFAFTWRDRRYAWLRLPQGWTWSPILFSERVAEAVEGLGAVQFVDDLLVGAETKPMLRQKLHEVFRRLQFFGLKVNLSKTQYLAESVTFLGVEIAHGHWSLSQYYRERARQVGTVRDWKALERLVGVLSYIRRTVVSLERVIKPLRERLKEARKGRHDEQWWSETNFLVKETLIRVLNRRVFLTLPGIVIYKAMLETDWSGEHAGYLLWVHDGSFWHLCDLGSKRMTENTSSFLGELKTIIWACKTTKAFRGDTPLAIRTDNLAVAEKLESPDHPVNDRRVLRLVGWLLANEDFHVDFIPGAENVGADLLSRPRRLGDRSRIHANVTSQVSALTAQRRRAVAQAHAGHWNWHKTLQTLRRQQGRLWPGAKEDVRQFVQECERCKLYGRSPVHPAYKSWDAYHPNELVFVDFLGPLSLENERNVIHVFLVIDAYSRYLRLTLATAPSTRFALHGLERWIREVGLPHTIVSDQAQCFMALAFDRFCQDKSMLRKVTPAYAPYSNGLCERAVGTVLGRLRRMPPHWNWARKIRQTESAYNNAWHASLRATPAEVLYGVRPDGQMLSVEAWDRLRARAERSDRERKERQMRQSEKARPNRRRIRIGDRVQLRVHHPHTKMSAEWEGDYTVVRQTGSRMWWLRDNRVNEDAFGPWHERQLRHLP